MSKPKSMPVPEADVQTNKSRQNGGGGMQAPLSGSKKTKQRNHVSHNNPEG